MVNTIKSLQNDYQTYLQAQNSNINAFAPNTYWEIQAGALAGSFLDLYGNLQLVLNSVYVQNSVGDQVDKWLYARGLPARRGLTYGTIVASLTTFPTPTVTIQPNTIFTDPITGNKYQNLETLVINSAGAMYTLYAVNAGNNYIEPEGALLDSNAGQSNNLQFLVWSSTNGLLEESDQSAINRILQAIRSPISGSRETDYVVYAMEASSEVTQVVPIQSFLQINSVSILGIFILVGAPLTEYQLNQGLISGTFVTYSREAGSDLVGDVNNYIQNLRLVGLSVIIGTSLTQVVASTTDVQYPPLVITVSLATGYDLLTPLTINSQDQNNNPITISISILNLIQREVRRAIVNQPQGGEIINGINFITLNSIEYAVNEQLSSTDGNIAEILTNLNIGGSDIVVPNIAASVSNIYYTYDIQNYDAITVVEI